MLPRNSLAHPVVPGMSKPGGAVGVPPAAASSPAAIAATPTIDFQPAGKSFAERLDAFLADAAKRYKVTVQKEAQLRSAKDAHTWHLAHMFVYNAFASRKPKQAEAKAPHTIKWSHFSKADLAWQHDMDWKHYLRTKDGAVPEKSADGKAWAAGKEPDEAKTRARALEILKTAGIATSVAAKPNGAMVASGYAGCGEPCRCGGNPSKHIAGLAVDLRKAQLPFLEKALREAKAGSLDNYLKKFGLARPMTSEPWHVEATAK